MGMACTKNLNLELNLNRFGLRKLWLSNNNVIWIIEDKCWGKGNISAAYVLKGLATGSVCLKKLKGANKQSLVLLNGAEDIMK